MDKIKIEKSPKLKTDGTPKKSGGKRDNSGAKKKNEDDVKVQIQISVQKKKEQCMRQAIKEIEKVLICEDEVPK